MLSKMFSKIPRKNFRAFSHKDDPPKPKKIWRISNFLLRFRVGRIISPFRRLSSLIRLLDSINTDVVEVFVPFLDLSSHSFTNNALRVSKVSIQGLSFEMPERSQRRDLPFSARLDTKVGFKIHEVLSYS